MRWPWQPKPGYVRISRKEYIRLLEGAVRYHRAEDLVAELKVETARIKAETRVYDAVRIRGLSDQDQALIEPLAALPPLTADGELHAEAFDALVDATVWDHREGELERLAADR